MEDTAQNRPKAQPAFVSARQAAELLGIGERKFHELRNEAWFAEACPPIELGARCLRWRRDELVDAISAHAPKRTRKPEPQQLAQQRAERVKAAA